MVIASRALLGLVFLHFYILGKFLLYAGSSPVSVIGFIKLTNKTKVFSPSPPWLRVWAAPVPAAAAVPAPGVRGPAPAPAPAPAALRDRQEVHHLHTGEAKETTNYLEGFPIF